MEDKLYIGSFRNEQKTLEAIRELKTEGYDGSDIYVVANDEDHISMIRGRTEAVYETADESWFEKFKDFLKGEEPIREAFEKMGFDREKSADYTEKAKEGSILVFVDRELGESVVGDANDLDGTGIGQRRPINKDPGAKFHNLIGEEAGREHDGQFREREQHSNRIDQEIHKTSTSGLSDVDAGDTDGAGLVGTDQHNKGTGRTLRNPKTH